MKYEAKTLTELGVQDWYGVNMPIKRRIWEDESKGLNMSFKENKSSTFLNRIEMSGL